MLDIDSMFEEYFPILAQQFKLKDFQKDFITNVVNQGNTLCIMPTGGGKPLIYWMAGLGLEGMTIVISPLIALIDEQSEKLREQGIEVLTIHGGIDVKKQSEVLIGFANKQINPRFIFVSPEKIDTDGLFEHCIKKRKDEIRLFPIDEVHCVSQWGPSFRPFYKRIPDFITNVYGDGVSPKVLALTATLNPKEVKDICNEFSILKSNIIKSNLLMRTEVALKILKYSDENEKEGKFWDILKIHKSEKTLVYVYRIKGDRGVEGLAERANELGYRATYFHGEMSANERQEIIAKYKNNEIDIVFATNAFGMGIDIPDIRTVIHFMIPESAEQYYQEVGRAARDGRAANAYLLYTNKNIQVKRTYFINGSFPKEEMLIKAYRKITENKVGLKTLAYFEDEEVQLSFPYFFKHGLIKLKCKAFSDLKGISSTKNKDIDRFINATKTKNLITTIKKTGEEAEEIATVIYESVINLETKLSKPLDRRLVIDIVEPKISDLKMKEILLEIEEKKAYKHELLDYLVYLIEDNNDSNKLHQEIGRYLGVDKHQLGRIYPTLKGDRVRSKSEVIIANLLYQSGIDYEYESQLTYVQGKWIEPDFTVEYPSSKIFYWEHVGMLGVTDYDNRWLEKQMIYEEYFPQQLIITYEGATISESAVQKIDKIRKM